MTSEEKFMFDLEGYIVLKNVLTEDEVAEMNAIADQKIAQLDPDARIRSMGKPSTWGAPYQALLDHPRVLPYLLEFLGPKVRVDHDYP
ncbi:MAG: hypothetical protein ACE1ZS_00215, partial [Candidatus Poribacteria bacterium]